MIKTRLVPLIKRILTQPVYDRLKYYLFYADLKSCLGLSRRRPHAEKVSIMIPSHTRVEHLREAVESALAQTHPNVEVLVMSDAPETRPERLLSDLLPRIRFFSEPELRSQSEKWNALVNRASGDLLLLLADDDKIAPTFVEKTLDALKAQAADIVYTDMRLFGAQTTHYACDWNRPFFESSPIPITSLFKRSVYSAVGGFADIPCIDWDFWWTASEKGMKAAHVREPLFLYRTHPGQDTLRMGKIGWEEARALVRSRHGGRS
jgi:glycosyltransferase involved in cell wall biosynthesis